MNHWKKQQRDSKGRWLSYDGTKGKRYTAEDIVKAWWAGHNDLSHFMMPKDKLRRYLEKNGIE